MVAYLDQTGSGVETIAHLRENGRIVVMFCAFTGPPRIGRLHGQGEVVTTDMANFTDLIHHFPGGAGVGIRSIIVVHLSRISDSCGYGVPVMSFEGHRPTMDQWSARKGPEGIKKYWSEKNAASIDDLEGLPPSSRSSASRHRPNDEERLGSLHHASESGASGSSWDRSS